MYPYIGHDEGDLQEVVHVRLQLVPLNLKPLQIDGTQLAPVHTDVLLMVLALCSHRLLRGAVAMLRAATQAVRHTIHLL